MNLNKTTEIPSLDLLEKIIMDDKYFYEFSNNKEDIIYGFNTTELISHLKDFIRKNMQQDNLSKKFVERAKYFNDKFSLDIPIFREVNDNLNKEFFAYVIRESENINNPLAKARMIYLSLAKVLCYDEHAPAYNQNLENPVMEDIYYKKLSSVTLNNTRVTCNLWALIYAECLKKVGIDAKVVGEGKHKYVEFMIEGISYTADATNSFLDKDNIYLNDLTRVKLNSPTLGFSGMEKIDDQQIGYDPQDLLLQYHEFSNNHYPLSSMRLTTGDPKTDMIVSKLDYLSTMAYKLPLIEAVGYLKQMVRTPNRIVTEDEVEKITSSQICLKDENGLNFTSLVITVKNGDEYIYKLLSNKEGLITVEKKYFKDLIARGEMLDEGNIPGIEKIL